MRRTWPKRLNPTNAQLFAAGVQDLVEHAYDRIIREEREACAKAAEAVIDGQSDSLANSTAQAIAILIRDRK